VPDDQLDSLLKDTAGLCGAHQSALLIKDVEPGHIRSWMGVWADKYLSGDKRTRLVSSSRLAEKLKHHFPNYSVNVTRLAEEDPPTIA